MYSEENKKIKKREQNLMRRIFYGLCFGRVEQFFTFKPDFHVSNFCATQNILKVKKVEIKHREQHRATKNIIHKIARRKKKLLAIF